METKEKRVPLDLSDAIMLIERQRQEIVALNGRIETLRNDAFEMNQVIAELKADKNIWHNATNDLDEQLRNLQAKLSRLIALINDDERAEKVAKQHGDLFGVAFVNRNNGINDYRDMLKKEIA